MHVSPGLVASLVWVAGEVGWDVCYGTRLHRYVRFALCLVALFIITAPLTSAQAFLIPGRGTGSSLSVGTSLNDGLSDASGDISATLAPTFDLRVAVSRVPLGANGLTAVGLDVAHYIERGEARFASISASYANVRGDRVSGVNLFGLGARAGRRVEVSRGLTVVPNLSLSVGLLTGNGVDSGIQTSFLVDVPMQVGQGVSVYVAPSVGLNSERAAYARGIDAFSIAVRGGVVFGRGPQR